MAFTVIKRQRYVDELVEGRWYWVRLKDDTEWFPALRQKGTAGGWTNGDCWEDFHREVEDWQLIAPPLPVSPRLPDSPTK